MAWLHHTPTRAPLARLFPLHDTNRILVHDTWVGMMGSLGASHDLAKTPEGAFRGPSRLRGRDVSRDVDAELSPALVRDALARMADVDCHLGNYTPNLDHTDDYPNLQITLVVDPGPDTDFRGGTLTLATESQHRHRIPWGVTVGGVAYTVYAPDLALVFHSWSTRLQGRPRWRPKERAVEVDSGAHRDFDQLAEAISAALELPLSTSSFWTHWDRGRRPPFRWTGFEALRRALDHAALARWLEREPAIPPIDCDDPTPREARIAAAKAGSGPTLFDLVVLHLDRNVWLSLK